MTEDKKMEMRKMPEEAADTNLYPIQTQIGFIPVLMDQVDDLATGGKRHRKYGAYFSAHIVPNLSESATPGSPVLVPQPPSAFVDAETLDGLRERIVYEIDLMIDSAKDIIENGWKGHDKLEVGPTSKLKLTD